MLCKKCLGNSDLTLVGLGARVRGCTTRCGPLVRPVAVDITTDTRITADSLTILAPQAVRGLRVDEAVRVHDGRDVEVKLVHHGLDGGIRRVLRQQRVRDVLGGLGRDPLAGVDVSVEHNGGLGALAATAPDMNAGKSPAAHRCSDGVDLGVGWEAGLKVVQEGQVLRIWVVCSEP